MARFDKESHIQVTAATSSGNGQRQPPPNHAAENQTQTLEQRKHEPAIFHQHFGIECTSEAFITTETKRSVVAV